MVGGTTITSPNKNEPHSRVYQHFRNKKNQSPHIVSHFVIEIFIESFENWCERNKI